MILKLAVILMIIALIFIWVLIGQFVYDEVINYSDKYFYKTFIEVLWPVAILVCIILEIKSLIVRIRVRKEDKK